MQLPLYRHKSVFQKFFVWAFNFQIWWKANIRLGGEKSHSEDKLTLILNYCDGIPAYKPMTSLKC